MVNVRRVGVLGRVGLDRVAFGGYVAKAIDGKGFTLGCEVATLPERRSFGHPEFGLVVYIVGRAELLEFKTHSRRLIGCVLVFYPCLN